MKKVLVGMSGGIDSSVAAALLKEKGYDVSGVTMTLYKSTDFEASRIADQLGIQHEYIDMKKEFWDEVIVKFAKEYEAGSTPNPCVVCNKKIKFGAMFDYAMANGFDYIATGHYVKLEKSDSGYYLLKAKDEAKDQTYFLYTMTQSILEHSLFPLGTYDKNEIRGKATEFGLDIAQKKESQDICFVENGDYGHFLSEEYGIMCTPGDFLDKSGVKIGTHRGIIHYTVGQRKGLGQTFGKPMYVLSKDAENNTVTLGSNEDLFVQEFYATAISMVNGKIIPSTKVVMAKTRYNQVESKAIIYPEDTKTYRVRFDKPQRAIAPGQAVVFYEGDKLLGGGTISLNSQ